jgi:hypothetical protein
LRNWNFSKVSFFSSLFFFFPFSFSFI